MTIIFTTDHHGLELCKEVATKASADPSYRGQVTISGTTAEGEDVSVTIKIPCAPNAMMPARA